MQQPWSGLSHAQVDIYIIQFSLICIISLFKCQCYWSKDRQLHFHFIYVLFSFALFSFSNGGAKHFLGGWCCSFPKQKACYSS